MAGSLFNLYTWTSSTGTLTITLALLASSAVGVGRASTAVDNSTTLAQDALVRVQLKNGAGTIANDKGAYIFAYGTADGGTTYDDGITGTDAGFTATQPYNLQLLAFLNMPTSATQYTSRALSVASAFNGILPSRWGVFIVNNTNIAFDATAGNHSIKYQLIAGSYT